MTKIIGGILLLAASVGFGLIKIREERRRIRLARAFCELVKHIRENIAHYMKPLPEIFRTADCPILEEHGFLGDCRERGIRLAWEKFSDSAENILPERVKRVLAEFSESIGGGYREDELNLCDYTIAELERAVREMTEDSVGKEKIYRTIPPLVALSAMLIFV